ncbi:MAG: hypothetical protein ABUS47_14330 [Steroidobacter sp.]
MRAVKWFVAVGGLILGAIGLMMSLCGGWFLFQDIVALFSRHSGYEAVIAVISIGSFVFGIGLLFLSRYIYRRLEKADGMKY